MSGEIMKKILDKPIAYHRVFVELGVGVTGAVLLSQAMYWGRRSKEEWFWKSVAQWEEETGLTVREQEGARRALREIGVLQEQRKSIPARLYFRVDFDVLAALLLSGNKASKVRKTPHQESTKPRAQICENRVTGCAKNAEQIAQTAQPDTQKPHGQIRENRESINRRDYTKTTTETTQRLHARPASQPGADDALPVAVPASAPQPAKVKAEPVDDGETALQAACKKTWAEYSTAYERRYGTRPVRNPSVNAKVKQFVQRLGFDESPAVAAFYVDRVNEAFVVRRVHDVGLLLSGAEGYRTQWAVDAVMTGTRARQIDQTQANADVADEAFTLLMARKAARAAGHGPAIGEA